jgi:hypothetical protein
VVPQVGKHWNMTVACRKRYVHLLTVLVYLLA